MLMPYVAESEALNGPFLELDAIAGGLGAAPWRASLVGTPSMRVVLLHWPPGYATVPHHHPRAEEIFLVISGRACFTIGDRPEREVGPGELMLAKRGELHAIRVPDGAPLMLLAAVGPNEAGPGETIEPASGAQTI
jgi:mannose-6-phosphate isomerase-like protein (cupin superfamily)